MSAIVTLAGLNFGESDASQTVLFALAVCSTTIWTAVTSVSCAAAPGASLVNIVGITVAGVVSTSDAVFSFDGD